MSTLLNLQGYSLQPQKYWFSFENLSKETESGSFQKVPDQEKCITFLSRFTAFYIRLENVDNLQDMSSMAPRCMGTDVVTLSLEVSSTKIWVLKRRENIQQKFMLIKLHNSTMDISLGDVKYRNFNRHKVHIGQLFSYSHIASS